MLTVHVPDRELAARVVELLVRLVISEFLAPSQQIDLTDEAVTREFVRTFVLPALQPALSTTR